MVVCLEQGADLHTTQLTPLPLTVSCFSNLQIGFTFLVPAHLGSPGKRAVKRECVCVCVCLHYLGNCERCSCYFRHDVVMPWMCRCMSMLGYRAVAAVNSAQGGNDVTATLQALVCE